ncbi:MAG: hypothetical protein ABI314_01250 [Gemmatimonadaceae bacterium]
MRDFAPVSGGPSARLRFAAGYFMFMGTFNVLLILFVLVMLARGHAVLRQTVVTHPAGLLIRAASVVLLLVTGYLLYERSRLGGIFAVLLFLPAIIGRAVGEHISMSEVVTAVVGLIIVVSVWRELDHGPHYR